MRHSIRRKELGRMLMDVAKYLATVGLIGGVLTNNLTTLAGIAVTIMVLILGVVAFFVIPPFKENK